MSSTRILITKTVSLEGEKKYSIKTIRGPASDPVDATKETTKDDTDNNNPASSQTTVDTVSDKKYHLDGTYPCVPHGALGGLTRTKEHTDQQKYAHPSDLPILKPDATVPLWRRVKGPSTGEWSIEPARLRGYIKNNRTMIRIFTPGLATTPSAPGPLQAIKNMRRKRKLNIRRNHELDSCTHLD